MRQAQDALLVFVANAPVGTRLPPERELAARFGVSRTTVRSAADRLALLGFLDVRHGSGTFTTRPGPDQLAAPFAAALVATPHSASDVFALRLMVEPVLAALVAVRAGQRTVSTLRTAAPGEDPGFHHLLASHSGNSVAAQLVVVLIGLSTASSATSPSDALTSSMAWRQHLAVVEAIAVHDPDLANESMQLHLRWEARLRTAQGAG